MSTVLLSAEAFASDVATLEGEPHHHLFRVKRHQLGDRLRAVDGRGRAREAEVIAVDKRAARLALGDALPANEPAVAVELYVAPPKPERAAWLVEKSTELGVAAIRFLVCERDARSFSAAQLERLRRVAVSAVEQCDRAAVPEIGNAIAVGALLAELGERGVPAQVLDRGEPGRSAEKPAPAPRLALLVGPEGGWSPAERALFDTGELPRWSLGERVLRIETAAVVAVGLVLAR